jgi:hypothetical protein
MLTAIVGIAGAILGALATGVVNYALQRRQETSLARAAELLMSEELKSVQSSLETTLNKGRWWPPTTVLPTHAWSQYGATLAGYLRRREWVVVANTIDVLEVLNDAASLHAPTKRELTEGEPEMVKDVLAEVIKAKSTLAHRARRRRNNALTLVGLVVALLLALGAVAGWAIYDTTRPDRVTGESLETALQKRLTDTTFVSCEHAEDAKILWNCYAVGGKSSCAASGFASFRANASTSAAASAKSKCETPNEATLRGATDEDGCWYIERVRIGLGKAARPPPAPQSSGIFGKLKKLTGCIR